MSQYTAVPSPGTGSELSLNLLSGPWIELDLEHAGRCFHRVTHLVTLVYHVYLVTQG